MGDKPQFDTLKKQFDRAVAKLTKIANAIDKVHEDHPEDSPSRTVMAEVESDYQVLRKVEDRLENVVPEMVALLKEIENSEADIEKLWGELEEHQYLLLKMKTKCQTLVDKKENERRDAHRPLSPPPRGSLPVASQPELIRLPQHELPKFTGLYAEWPSFWDQFQVAIEKRANLSNAYKLSYLKMCLAGEPLDLVKTVAITDDNYNSATTILKLRYEDSEMILQELMEAVLGAPSVQPGNLQSLRRLLNIFTEKVEALKNAGIDQGYFFLTHIILRKLDSETRRSWVQYNQEELRWTDFRVRAAVTDPKAADIAGRSARDQEFVRLMDFIVQRVQLWERSVGGSGQKTLSVPRQKTSTAAPISTNSDSFYANQPHATPQASLPATAHLGNLQASKQQERQPPKMACPMCNGKDHVPLHQCPQFIALDQTERRTAARRLKACFKCLAYNHAFRECRSKYNCKRCGSSSHHWLIHEQPPSSGAAIDAGADNEQGIHRPLLNGAIARAPEQLKQDSQIDSRTLSVPKSTTPSASDSKTPSVPNSRTPGVHVAKGSVVFLCTIQLPVINAYGTVTTLRAMLDTGSQVEMISKSAAEKLGWDITGKPVSIRGVGGGKLKNHTGGIAIPGHASRGSALQTDLPCPRRSSRGAVYNKAAQVVPGQVRGVPAGRPNFPHRYTCRPDHRHGPLPRLRPEGEDPG